MKKISLLFVCLFIGMLWVGESKAQGYTPPSMVFGFSLDGILATNDAHGSSLSSTHVINSGDYGMVWGRGASLTAKFGLGLRKNHRITVGAHYSKMVHDNTGELPFFNLKASAPYTNYDIFTGSAGYEYTFNARCKTKQSIGLALTTNYITGEKNALYYFDNSFRVGFQVSVNYEWTLGKAQKMGLLVGGKYGILNVIGNTNGPNTLQDGSGVGGAGFYRRIGLVSINVGLNFYSGVKPYRAK